MLAIKELSLFFGGEALFSNINFLIRPEDRIGLTGKNGAGKSSLLKIITGELQPTEGEVSVPGEYSIGYLPQQLHVLDSDTSVMDEVKSAFTEVKQLETKIHVLQKEITEREDYHSADYQKCIDQLTESTERYDMLGGDTVEAYITQSMTGLGFEQNDMQRPVREFSGGWRMRIELAKIILVKPSLLLLDEPTNHLDIESIRWLESFLQDYSGAVMLISHDRMFLDRVTKRTLEIELGKVYDYPVPYSKYLKLREERIHLQRQAWENQQKEIAQAERFIERFRYKATKANQVQARVKALDKMERIQIEEKDLREIHFRFPPAPRSGAIVVESRELGKSFDGLEVLRNTNISIERGEKVAFLGRNGMGKTTMLRIIMGELDYSGHLKTGHNVDIGYYAQDQAKRLDEKLTVYGTLEDIAVGEVRHRLRDILGSFMFSGEDVDKKVSVLSGGEKARLALARLLLHPHNLLILDEPTNHLDIRSKERLKQALKSFDGSMILVSHDRYFLDGLVDKVYEFRHLKVREHLGGISDYLRRAHHDSNGKPTKNRGANSGKKMSHAKSEYLKRKEADRQKRKLENRVAKLEAEISQLETKMEEIEGEMQKNADDPAIFQEYQKLEKRLEQFMDEWERVNRDLSTP